jgi:hypothetical protein
VRVNRTTETSNEPHGRQIVPPASDRPFAGRRCCQGAQSATS